MAGEFSTLVHGILLGDGVPFPFSGGLAGFYSLRGEYLTPAGMTERIGRLEIGTSAMARVGAAWWERDRIV